MFKILLFTSTNFFWLIILIKVFCLDVKLSVAQIKPDNTLGTGNNSQVKSRGRLEEITGGTQAGNNIFHSFKEFSIKKGQAAYFIPPDNIINIFARVTGTNLSKIDGVLGVKGQANLFFLNPNGIIFGDHAKLRVNGSFLATTGDSFIFADGSKYSATQTSAGALLTVTAVQPVGIRFEGQSGKILNYTTLTVPEEKTLGLIGGDLELNSAAIINNGNIQLGSIQGNNTVSINPFDLNITYGGVKEFGDINLYKSRLDSSGTIAGSIQIYGKNINVNHTKINSRSSEFNTGKNINLVATQSINISESSTIATNNGKEENEIIIPFLLSQEISQNTTGSGKAGKININAGQFVYISNSNVKSQVNARKSQGGRLTIEAENVEINQGGIVDNIATAGNPGDIFIKARNSIIVTNGGTISGKVQLDATAKGGDINIETKKLIVSEGGSISTSTLDRFDGGNIIIKATDYVLVTGHLPNQVNESSIISAKVETFDALGNAGKIVIDTSKFLVKNTGVVTTTTEGKGNGGEIAINASDFVEISGRVANNFSRVNARSVFTTNQGTGEVFYAWGDGGNIEITTSTLLIKDGGIINVSSEAPGQAGKLTIKANSIMLDTEGSLQGETSNSKTGGDIKITSRDYLMLRSQSKISTSAGKNRFSGNGGNISITTPVIIAFPQENSNISADANFGSGGKIQIKSNLLGIVTRDKNYNDGLSDITAASRFGVQGVVNISNFDLNPNLDLNYSQAQPISFRIVSFCEGSELRPSFTLFNGGKAGSVPDPFSLYEQNQQQIISPWLELKSSEDSRSSSIQSPLVNEPVEAFTVALPCKKFQ